MISHHTAIFKSTEGEAIWPLTGNAFGRKCKILKMKSESLLSMDTMDEHPENLSGISKLWSYNANVWSIFPAMVTMNKYPLKKWRIHFSHISNMRSLAIRHFAKVLMLGRPYFMLKVSLVTTQNVWKEGLLGKMVVQKLKYSIWLLIGMKFGQLGHCLLRGGCLLVLTNNEEVIFEQVYTF